MKIKKVYLGRKQIYPDWWSPGENTVFYIKWEWDIVDYWPNNLTFTNNLVTVTDNYLNFPWTSKNRLVTSWANIPENHTLNTRMYITWIGTSYYPRIVASWSTDAYIALYIWSWGTPYTLWYNNRSDNGTILPNNTWFNLVITKESWWQAKAYINSTLTNTENSASVNYWTWIIIWCKYASQWDSYQGRMAHIILESKVRTDQEISDYFNKTKSLYGIS